MEIKFYGQACFSVENKGIQVVLDPFSEGLPNLEANVVTVSCEDPAYNNAAAVGGEPRVFDWPGEYETKGVHFHRIPSFRTSEKAEKQLANTITIIHFNGIRLCHLGAQGRPLTEEQVEQIGDADVLFLPVGGESVLTPKEAKKMMEEIEPRVVIPMCYATEGSSSKFGPLSAFLSELGSKPEDPADSFKFKKSELPDDNTKIVILNPAH